ncbi:MAG: TOBE domain-containing protein, partial [Mycobacterium sp.]
VNVFVAGFMGSPAMNLFTLPVVDGSVSLGDCVIPVGCEIAAAGHEVVVGVRPEHFQVGGDGGEGVEFEVDFVEELGADAYLYGRITVFDNAAQQSVIARVAGSNPARRGSRLRLRPDGGHLHFFTTGDGRRIG